MNISEINAKSLSELKDIISKMPDEYKNKIPKNLKNNIEKNCDPNYSWNEKKEILPETKALLVVIIRKYFNNEDFNKKIEEYINFYKTIDNEENMYNVKFPLQNTASTKANFKETKNIVEEKSLEILDQKWYSKIIRFFKKIIKK